MRARAVLLFLLNLAITAKLYGRVGPLAVYLAIGYLLVLYAWSAHDRASGALRSATTAITLGAWVFTWLVFKQGTPISLAFFDRFPSLGLPAFDRAELPQLIGASYIFLKVYDLIRRAQRGDRPPGVVLFLTQMTFAPSFAVGPIAGPEAFERGLAPTRRSIGVGLNRIIAGLLKLQVLAPLIHEAGLDALGARGAAVLDASSGRLALWLGVYGSALWVYFNFAGWSDIAIGLGRLMGVTLPENFDSPYLAPNPSEFWQRWHMSFTSWLREHVFSPASRALVEHRLGGTVIALVITTTMTMVACAAWHQPTKAFLVWGLYQAALVIAHQLFATRVRPRLASRFLESRGYRALATIATFHAIAIGWVLFLPVDAPLSTHLANLGRLIAPW